jgi:hypothetical protein
VQCHVADWCNRLAKVWPWPPLSSSFTKAVTTITVRELSDAFHIFWYGNCNTQDEASFLVIVVVVAAAGLSMMMITFNIADAPPPRITVSTPWICMPTVLLLLIVGNWKVWHWVGCKWHNVHTEFLENRSDGSEVRGGDSQTDIINTSLWPVVRVPPPP